MPSNVRYGLLIHPYRGSDAEAISNYIREEYAGLTAKINAEHEDIFVRGFWARDIYFIVDVRICDVNQPYYLSRNLSAIIKSAETEKKKSQPLSRVKTAFQPMCRLL